MTRPEPTLLHRQCRDVLQTDQIVPAKTTVIIKIGKYPLEKRVTSKLIISETIGRMRNLSTLSQATFQPEMLLRNHLFLNFNRP